MTLALVRSKQSTIANGLRVSDFREAGGFVYSGAFDLGNDLQKKNFEAFKEKYSDVEVSEVEALNSDVLGPGLSRGERAKLIAERDAEKRNGVQSLFQEWGLDA